MAIDHERVATAVREFLAGIGEDPSREGLAGTPERVARACEELFEGMSADPATVLSTTFELSHDELVLVKGIEVRSICEHHLLPFIGVAHVAYVPSGHRIVGLSKLARLVDVYARRPQIQERLTSQVADALVEHLAPQGVLVVVECEHLCMTMRGVHKTGAQTVTSAVRGILRDSATRAETLSLIAS